MRITYIASRWDYGFRERGPSFEETNFLSALVNMGHDVSPYDFLDRFKAVGREEMNRELLNFVRERDPEFVFFFLFKDEIDVDTVRHLTDEGFVTFNWFADDHWRFDSFSRHYAPAFSLVATTDAQAIPKYQALPNVAVVHTQWACNRYAYFPVEGPALDQVSFVGQPYGERQRAMRRLSSAGIDARSWGQGWKSGRLNQREMVEVFSRSRINLNFSQSFSGRLWNRRRAISQIKARPFEVAGCGGFLLTDPAPGLDQYFEYGSEIAIFRGVNDLVQKARYWLERDEERARIAEAGYRRVLAEHTYDHRFEKIFRAAGLA
jgi:spore maturation protein CgeB